VRFAETRLEHDGNRVRLVGRADEVLLELRGHEIDEAVRAGFVDRDNYHFSMFEYAKIRALTPGMAAVSAGPRETGPAGEAFDREYLSRLNIRWE
jgi:hypothetical protein